MATQTFEIPPYGGYEYEEVSVESSYVEDNDGLLSTIMEETSVDLLSEDGVEDARRQMSRNRKTGGTIQTVKSEGNSNGLGKEYSEKLKPEAESKGPKKRMTLTSFLTGEKLYMTQEEMEEDEYTFESYNSSVASQSYEEVSVEDERLFQKELDNELPSDNPMETKSMASPGAAKKARLERFGGMHRQESYKQSKKLFEDMKVLPSNLKSQAIVEEAQQRRESFEKSKKLLENFELSPSTTQIKEKSRKLRFKVCRDKVSRSLSLEQVPPPPPVTNVSPTTASRKTLNSKRKTQQKNGTQNLDNQKPADTPRPGARKGKLSITSLHALKKGASIDMSNDSPTSETPKLTNRKFSEGSTNNSKSNTVIPILQAPFLDSDDSTSTETTDSSLPSSSSSPPPSPCPPKATGSKEDKRLSRRNDRRAQIWAKMERLNNSLSHLKELQ